MFVLVHSPLVGPSTWAPVAAELERRGESVLIPSLPDPSAMPPPRWRACVDAVQAAIAGTDPAGLVLVSHSGSGVLLPAISTGARAYIFVDGEVPHPGVIPVMPEWLRENVVRLATGDRLPPWSEWWGPDAMARLVPDPDTRAAITADLPRLPLDYVDEAVEVPAWPEHAGAYLQLSPLFADTADDAQARGWPVERIDAGHLHLVVDPADVADRIVRLARQVHSSP
jgi:hypothetical protein